ncbi:hypothetical protein SAMN05421819_3215 [Bryocella elongata]|uniref:Uncharacterized protein n=1 Tax=Bryocella elongata TaxID=863522 RepID=A0A1H6ALU3_9BACT|nr:hypothetical protein [Bryocella elongata]SEG49005.1 hypothetical protein SAMN05421819_3215 [Bryocella elongata]
MRPLSAIDAISPAWNHTRNLLWAPRSWRLLLKVGLVAVLAQMAGFNLSGNKNMNGPMHGAHTGLPAGMVAALVAGIVALVIAGLVIWAVLFYVGSRMQFVLFEVVLRRDTTIGPIWSRYSAATWRWIALKLAFLAVVLLALAPVLVPMLVHMLRTLPHLSKDPRQIAGFFVGMLGYGMVLFVVGTLLGAAYRLLVSFALPSMALESTTLRETVRRVFNLAQAEPVDIFLFLLMNFLLSLAGAMAGGLVLGIFAVVVVIPLGGAGAVLWAILRHSGVAGHAVLYTGAGVLGLVAVALIVVTAIILFGYLYTFLQAYALYFLGGRYPRVGAYLEPLLPPAPAYVPASGFAAPPAS